MEKKKKILVMGLGTTGLSVIEALQSTENQLYIYDDKKKEDDEFLAQFPWYQGEEIDFVVKSPGIPLNHPLVQSLIKKYPIYSDIEMAYRLTKSKNIVAITGTNGKTTMTKLLGEVIEKSGRKVLIGGNVGVGILPLALEAKEEDILVIECSSFQLETTDSFKPKIAIISNITEDHIDHHLSLSSYRESKKKIYENQDQEDSLILNIDDPYSALVGEEEERAYVVSLLPLQQKGAFLSEGVLYYNLGDTTKAFMDRKDIKVVGDHNIRNLLEILLAALLLGIDEKTIQETYKNFRGVEHRIEYLGEAKSIKYYNDSKGTNPDSTEVAIRSMSGPVHLLIGGYDKGVSFLPFLDKTKDLIKYMYIFGQTAPTIEREAKECGMENYQTFETMEEALQASFEHLEKGDCLLLSPACASWDQFKNYEERGNLFKKLLAEKVGVGCIE